MSKQVAHMDGQSFRPSILRVLSSTQADIHLNPRTIQSVMSLDRSLKTFLASSNLPGLEYRLRVAGYRTLSDLLDADEELLCSHGFTPIMARRLLKALDDYIRKQLERREGRERNPFQLVRKGQRISSAPTEKMKGLPTFGKKNVKRHRHADTSVKGSGKKSSSSKGGKGGGGGGAMRPRSYIRLMSEDSLPSEPIFPNHILLEEDTSSETTPLPPSNGEGVTPRDPVQREGLVTREASFRESRPVFQEFYMPDEIDSGRVTTTTTTSELQEWIVRERANQRLRRCNSVPADYRFHSSPDSHHHPPLSPWWDTTHIRPYSCPPMLTPPPSPITLTLGTLSTSQDYGVVTSSLHQLCLFLKDSGLARVEVRESGGMGVILDILKTLSTDPTVVLPGLRSIKYLTREVVLPEGVVPRELMAAVLGVVDTHATNRNISIHGALALGNIGRAVPSLCHQLLEDMGLVTLAHALGAFPSCPLLQVSVMSALGVGLGCCPERRLYLLAHHGLLLDRVLLALKNFPAHVLVQEYSCSFLALLLAEVAVEMESGVVELIVEYVCVAMTTHGASAPVVLWGSKALANAAPNVCLGDDVKLAGHCCSLLTGALEGHHDNHQIWTWCLYAILQITSRNCAVISELVNGGLVSYLKEMPTELLDQEAGQYAEQLLAYLIPPAPNTP